MAGRSDDARPTEHRRTLPVALVGSGALVVLIAVAAAFSSPLTFSGPRFLFPGSSAVVPSPTSAAQPPPSAPSTRTPAPADSGATPNLTWILFVLLALVLGVIVFAAVRWYRARRRDAVEGVVAPLDGLGAVAPDAEPTVETSAPYLRRGLLRAIDVLDGDRPPTDAIVAAWLGLQEAAEDAGWTRQISETPTEFTTRILRLVDVDRAPLDTLRRLYLAVRFGDATATDDDVRAARRALETLSTQWSTAEATP
ncbi:hypothetical protein AS850_13365 [Frondihabitans sp. 762G35]|uniref:DUF4129 domain-containing protein n=1 Tax=Frondihabitans sp. 762G35 TaxID=1446794 RepID=UPI000D22B212|nr:DUF4129 domain-containing protein [Frondihabitans sp. 762G35]ARC58066.1 hypothetical protein AS850_13365 [Frondihabitans sp. 762G35]